MRRRLSKRERNTGWIIGTILVATIMVVAIFYIRQTYFGPVFEYKGYKVLKNQPAGFTEPIYVLRAPIRIYGSTELHFVNLYNDPRGLEDIEVEPTTRVVLLDPKPDQVYITFDPDMENKGHIALASTEIARALGTNGIFRMRVNGAITKSVEGLESRVFTCDDSSETQLIVELRYAEETKVFVDEHFWRCIVVQGKDEVELLRASDKVVLALLGLD